MNFTIISMSFFVSIIIHIFPQRQIVVNQTGFKVYLKFVKSTSMITYHVFRQFSCSKNNFQLICIYLTILVPQLDVSDVT